MSYVHTDDDIDLIFQHHQEVYSKFELLDEKMKMIDSLEGVSIDASIDIDATSDTRRTYSGTIILNQSSVAGQYSVFDWTNKFVRIYIGMKSTRTLAIKWYPMGLFVFNQNGFKYSHTEHTVSISCTDLIAKLDGTLSGALTGSATIIKKDSEIRKAIIETVKLMGFEKTLVNYWDKKVPYDLEFGTGTTVWNILTEMRDLYYPFEMYFDDDTFVCNEIPDCKDDPVVLDYTVFDKVVIDENTTIDYSEIKNCVEVWGASINSDAHAEVNYDNGLYTLTIAKEKLRNGAKYSFLCPVNNPFGCSFKVVCNENSIGPFKIYESSVDENKNDVELPADSMLAGRSYVIKYDQKAERFYYQGQTDIHAMTLLVDKLPTAEEIEQAKKDEACENLRFIAATDPSDTLGLYDNPFSIDRIGRRNYICSGGDFENIYTDSLGMQRAEYELWKSARLTDSIQVTTLLIPWLGVNQKVSYTPKGINQDESVEYIVKKISISLSMKCIGAKNGKIIFTSGASEANTLAISSVVANEVCEDSYIITTPFEHDSVLNTIAAMRCEHDVGVSYLKVSSDGFVDPAEIERLINKKTILVSVMAVNNEIGTIQPIKEIGAICKKKNVLFHVDATQAVGHIPIDVTDMNIDLLTMSAHKFHGPKGIGALYVSSNVPYLHNMIYGGYQEGGVRPGTENVPGIIGMGIAIEMSTRHLKENTDHVKAMRDLLLSSLLEIPGAHLNGSYENRVAGNINITFDHVEGESLLLMMDTSGVCASAGSACSAGQLHPSHVLTAIGLDRNRAMNSIRLSLGEDITEAQVGYIAKTVKNCVEYLRNSLK